MPMIKCVVFVCLSGMCVELCGADTDLSIYVYVYV